MQQFILNNWRSFDSVRFWIVFGSFLVRFWFDFIIYFPLKSKLGKVKGKLMFHIWMNITNKFTLTCFSSTLLNFDPKRSFRHNFFIAHMTESYFNGTITEVSSLQFKNILSWQLISPDISFLDTWILRDHHRLVSVHSKTRNIAGKRGAMTFWNINYRKRNSFFPHCWIPGLSQILATALDGACTPI